jgi:cell wall-associated NlpC family hydrolase
VETLPSALGRFGILMRQDPAVSQATASLVASYASAAYRLGTTSAAGESVVTWAEAQLGKPYMWGAAGPDRFDCSGLTMAAFAQTGIPLPHNAAAQGQQTRADSVAEDQLAPGDLVFVAGK